MVQEFYVLKCCSCKLFQVHIVKKVKKWNCKVCGEKQSVVKVFGQGSAKDCRLHVQKLNQHRSQNLSNSNEKYDETGTYYESSDLKNSVKNDYEMACSEGDQNGKYDSSIEFRTEKFTSRWQKYLEPMNSKNELYDNLEFQVQKDSLSCKSNFVQCDEHDESTSKKSFLPRNSSEAGNNGNLKSTSKKIFHFLSEDEIDTIDDILDV